MDDLKILNMRVDSFHDKDESSISVSLPVLRILFSKIKDLESQIDGVGMQQFRRLESRCANLEKEVIKLKSELSYRIENNYTDSGWM